MGMVFVVAARINRVASDSFGFAFFQFMQDGGQYGVSLLQDFVVPEGDNGESQVLQVSCPCFVISGLFGVLPAVYFDNQFGVHADEIEDVLTQRLLAAEAVAAQSFAAQVFPQPLFGRRHVFAQVSAVVHEMRVIMREAFVVHFLWVFVAARINRAASFIYAVAGFVYVWQSTESFIRCCAASPYKSVLSSAARLV